MPPSFPSSDAPSPLLLARERFFSGAAVPEDMVAAPILRSWTRCAARGLPVSGRTRLEPLSAGDLRAVRESHELLRRRCRPELEALHADAAMTDSIVVLTDPSGLVLDMVGSADFAGRAARVALQPGVAWSEAAGGTNAIGTALVERRPIEVRGAEHYSEPHHILTCAAAPILDPHGELVGLLDITGPATVPHLHALGLVRLAVDQVEHRMFEGAFPGRDLVRFHADPSFLGTAREGILVFEDHRLVAANRAGLALLGLGWEALSARRFGELFDTSLARLGDGRAQDGPAEERRAVRGAGGARLHLRMERQPDRSAPRACPAPEGVPQPWFDGETRAALARAVRLVDAGVPVLIQGETGTGKEVFGRRMHKLSARAGRPFAAINCAALPEGLIESELFGYEAGAFTGARRTGFKGLLREADGGVLFLDEIGDMPLALQTRLLRVLQEREVTPLGGGRPVAVDFVLACASHRDLKQRVEAGAFRADLYFRIAQYTVVLPALRAHADRAGLVDRLWADLAAGPGAPRLSARCRALLAGYDWPGNFRQLVGTLKVLHALGEPGGMLDEDALPADIRSGGRPASRAAMAGGPAAREAAAREVAMREAVVREAVVREAVAGVASPADGDLGAVTRAAMEAALHASTGNVSQAARRLGIHRSTLHRHLSRGKTH